MSVGSHESAVTVCACRASHFAFLHQTAPDYATAGSQFNQSHILCIVNFIHVPVCHIPFNHSIIPMRKSREPTLPAHRPIEDTASRTHGSIGRRSCVVGVSSASERLQALRRQCVRRTSRHNGVAVTSSAMLIGCRHMALDRVVIDLRQGARRGHCRRKTSNIGVDLR
jgi:hypothetical protein